MKCDARIEPTSSFDFLDGPRECELAAGDHEWHRWHVGEYDEFQWRDVSDGAVPPTRSAFDVASSELAEAVGELKAAVWAIIEPKLVAIVSRVNRALERWTR